MRRAALLLMLLAAANAFAAGRIRILNYDLPGDGFNDPTPVEPVGGNPGTTLGEQRLNVFRAAAQRWESSLDVKVDIRVAAQFKPLSVCTETTAILGQATPIAYKHSFAAAPKANVWYPIALANQMSGADLEPTLDDILTQFNASVDNDNCLGTRRWYYGLDGNHGDDFDLFVVVLHELAHGLGVSGATGAPYFREGVPSTFDTHAIDVQTGLRWDQMTEQQRRASMTNTGRLAWEGENVRQYASRYLTPLTTITITEPAAIAGSYDTGFATFGPSASSTPLSGQVVLATDEGNPDGPSTTDGCTAFTNASAVAGKIALVDRRGCTYATKVRNAQAAGAAGVVVVDKADLFNPQNDTCLPMGMTSVGDVSDIRIPVVSVSRADGERIKAQLAAKVPVGLSLRVDPSRLAGTTPEGYLRLYAPCVPIAGSSIHHWDTLATPNLLMEPSVNPDLLHGIDLTLYQLLDMGWSLPPRSGRRILKR